jgi:hypothetical protein
MNNNTYETVYGVGLLDDLHNYFPGLLYDQGRFTDVSSVFHYMRSQMNSRFNLYSYGQSIYRQSHPQRTPVAPTPTPLRTTETDAESLATTAFLLSMLGGGLRTTPILGSRILNSGALNAGARTFFPGFSEPVIVRPTEEQIEQGTELITGLTTNQSCAICQDLILPTESCRRLRLCRHTYHRGCIDEWFERNVRCPICRHDIRDQIRDTNEPTQ